MGIEGRHVLVIGLKKTRPPSPPKKKKKNEWYTSDEIKKVSNPDGIKGDIEIGEKALGSDRGNKKETSWYWKNKEETKKHVIIYGKKGNQTKKNSRRDR